MNNKKSNSKKINVDLCLSLFFLFYYLFSNILFNVFWGDGLGGSYYFLAKNYNFYLDEYINMNYFDYILVWILEFSYFVYGLFNNYYDKYKDRKVYIIYMTLLIIYGIVIISFIIFPRNPLEPLEFYKSGQFRNILK